jgi:hypothetical protein
MLLSELAPLVNAQQGVIYQMESEEDGRPRELLSAFADDGQDGHPQHLKLGEGLVGQCAAEKQSMLITQLPQHAVPIRSGLFRAVPRNVIVLPVLFEDQREGRHRAGLAGHLHGLAPGIPRTADGQHRHRAEQH